MKKELAAITPETSSGCKHLDIGYSLLAVGYSQRGEG